jgi:hypothetical protein
VTITLDGLATVTNWSNSSSSSITLTTTLTDDIIVVVVAMEEGAAGPARSVTSITDTAGLTWAKRSAYQYTAGSNYPSVEVWYAKAAAALSADVITINLDGNIDDACICAFGVNGLRFSGVFWDSNTGLPVETQGASSYASVGYNTFNTNDMLLAIVGTGNVPTGMTTPTGWTNLCNLENAGASFACGLHIDYEIVSTVQSGSYQNGGGVLNNGIIAVIDALTAGGSPAGQNLRQGLLLGVD